jgi:hypothetical protein
MRILGGSLFLVVIAVPGTIAACGGSAMLLQSDAGADGASSSSAGPDGCIAPTDKNFYDYAFPDGECASATTCKPGSTAFPSALVDYAYSCGGAPGAGRDPVICVKPYCPPPQGGADAGDRVTLPPSGGGCGGSATTEACVTCCRTPDAPNYGAFELLAQEACSACSSCKDLSPCGTNVTPPADKTCVACLQKEIGTSLLPPPPNCANDAKCTAFAECLRGCPLR